jgi:hypothetical protein
MICSLWETTRCVIKFNLKEKFILNKIFNCSSVRLQRYLYSLGFEKESYINEKGKENWKFEHTNDLQQSLDFYFYMRNINKNK